VTKELFAGRSWRDDLSLLPRMTRAFSAMRRVHDWLLLLREAEKAPLNDDDRNTLAALRQRFEGAMQEEELARLDTEACERDVHIFLRTLQKYFASK